MQAIKETASNIGASAKSGMDKTVAVVEEKIEKMKAHDPAQKAVATEKKEQRIAHAEWEKHAAQEHNAAAKQNNNAGGAAADADGGYGSAVLATTTNDYGKTGMQSHTHATIEESGHVMGGYEMSAIPGRKTEQIYHENMADGANKIHPSERTDNAVYGSGNNIH